MLIEVAYCSVATRVMNADDLRGLLEVARRRNAMLGVTGMLIYSNRTREFLQLLEGEEEAIDVLMAAISEDDRHMSMDVMYRGPIERRSFDDWSMAFRSLDDLDPELLDGCTTFVAESLSSRLREGRASRARLLMASLSEDL